MESNGLVSRNQLSTAIASVTDVVVLNSSLLVDSLVALSQDGLKLEVIRIGLHRYKLLTERFGRV